MSNPQHTVTIQGEVSWELLFDYDNTTNTGTIRDKVTVEVNKSINFRSHQEALHSTIRRQLQSSQTADASLEKACFVSISAKIDDVSNEVNETVQQTTKETFEASFREKRTYERDIVVGPRGKLALYQQRFTAPGISIMGSTLSTNPPPKKSVTIEYLVETIRFVKGIQNFCVRSYTATTPVRHPPNRVREYNNGNDDINAGYGGKFVWLVPIYTYDTAEAATTFDLYIQESGHPGWADLAAGAGGSFRFIMPATDSHNPVKVTDIKLYRLDHGIGGLPGPYTKCTGDINANRKKTFLYLMWSTRTAF